MPEYLFANMQDHMAEIGYASISEYLRELIRKDIRESGMERNTVIATQMLRSSLARTNDR